MTISIFSNILISLQSNFQYILALFLGIFSGILTGLFPGIHVNLISVLVVSFSSLLLLFTSPLTLSIYIISLAITHSFLDSLPSIYLGAPDEAQALSVLPGHKLLNAGEGHNAIVCTVIGSFSCLILGILLFPLFLKGMDFIYPKIDHLIGHILILTSTVMILREKKGKKLSSLLLFLLAGTLGILVFSIPTLRQPLFPLLSGLFGFSIMIVSLQQQASVPKQDLKIPLKLNAKNAAQSISAASFVGFIAAFLPGFGNSQAAILANELVKEPSSESFLVLTGGINTANMLISIGTIFMLDKARNGAIVAVKDLLGTVTKEIMILFLIVAVTVGSIATLLTITLSKTFANKIKNINYTNLIISIILLVTCLTIIFDGPVGLIILVTATSIGLIASSLGIGKNHLMGSLIIPVALYFLL